MSMRRFVNRIHLYLGLVASLPLLVLSVTGALLVFETELDRWLAGELFYIDPGAQRRSYQELHERAQAASPGVTLQVCLLPAEPHHAIIFTGGRSIGERTSIYLNPYTAQVLGQRRYLETFMGNVRVLHTHFYISGWGHYIGGVSCLILLASLLTGLVLWWPKGKKKWLPLLIKWGHWRRANFDAHRALGFYTVPAVFLIALTGAVFTFHFIARPVIYFLTDSKPADFKVSCQPIPGQAPLSLDEAIEAARGILPEAQPMLVIFPRSENDPLRLNSRMAWQPRETGRTYLWLHPQTGQLLHEVSPRTRSTGDAVVSWNRHLHVGAWGRVWGTRWELATKILWLLASLMPVFLAITGLLIWWKPTRKPVASSASSRSSG